MSRSPVAVLYDSNGNAVEVKLENDGTYSAQITGRVVSVPAQPPPAKTRVVIVGDTPLAFGGNTSPEEDEFTIPNGETFTAVRLVAGSEGDSTEAGSRVDAVYIDALGGEHIISRQYVAGFTVDVSGETDLARDGTTMVGDGVNTKIVLRRYRLSNGSLEVDAVLVGYY
jgi:hypothetical protein